MLLQRKNKKKALILGTSPLMMIVYHIVNKEYFVKIFEEKKVFGGAWQQFKINGLNYNKHTNVIVPGNFLEENLQKKLNLSLKKNFKIDNKIETKKHIPLGYLSKKNYKYDLSNIFNINENIIETKKIKNIHITSNHKVKIDNQIYDKVFIPYFCGINEITINQKKYKIPYKIINSKHIFLIIRKKILAETMYTEKFDQIFDRCQINYHSEKTILTARVKHEFKNYDKKKIIKLSSLNQYIEDIEKSKVVRYKNYYRDNKNLEILKKLSIFKCIEIINTFQFYEGYLDLMKKYDL